MTPKLLSLNRALASTPVAYRGKSVETGIYKKPVEGELWVGIQGIEGDLQVDRRHHGGPDKAVYVYSAENYQYWEGSAYMAGTPLAPGYFGENLTVEGMLDRDVCLGDTFRVGELLMQVTQPRVPCFKLGVRVGSAGFVASFMTSGRCGFYMRVLEEGRVRAGNSIEPLLKHRAGITVECAMRALIKGPDQREIIKRVLSVDALSAAWREDLEKRLNP